MKHWISRLRLLWKFVQVIPKARDLELDLQKAQQKMHDLQFSVSLNPSDKEKEFMYQAGYIEGIKYCVGKFNG